MKPLSLLFLSLAPFLSLADAVHGAPAVGDLSQHRRALAAAQALDSPWHRRGVDSKRQADTGNGDTNNNGGGPPTAFTVPLPSPTTTDPASTTTPDPNAQDTTTTTPADAAQTPATTTTTTTPADPAGNSPTTTTTTTPDTPADSPTTTTTPDSPTTTTTPDAPTDSPTTTTTTTPDTPADTPTTTTTPPPVDTTTTEVPPADPTTTTTPTPDPPVTTTTTTDPGADQVTSPTDTPTTTTPDPATTTTTGDPLLGGVTSLLGGVTSDLGNVVTQVTSDLGAVTSDLGGITTSATDIIPPPDTTTTTPDQPTDTTTTGAPIDTGGVTDTGSPTDTGTTPTTTSTTSQILNVSDGIFPTTTDTDVLSNIITTIVDTTSRASISIDSQYQFITASSFLIAPTPTTTTLPATITDPDAALSTASLPTGGTAVTLTAGVIPSNIPMFITPPADDNPVPLGASLDGYTQISILFQMTVNWLWVLESPETAAQILAYIPPLITTALNTGSDSLRTVGLKAFEPAQLNSASDLATMYVGQLRTELVDDLAALIRAPDSAFYQSGDSVAQSIAHSVVMSFNIATLDGVSNEDGSANSSSNSSTKIDNSRRNAIIGVSVAFGLIALAVFAWWILKTYRARQEGAHKRLSYGGAPNYGTAGAGVPAIRADSPPAIHNPFMTEREREEEARGIRRNSFYAIGPDDASLEEETFDYMSQRSSGLRREGSGGRGWGAQAANSSGRLSPNYGLAGHPYARKPVVGQPISQPILRESSMGNW